MATSVALEPTIVAAPPRRLSVELSDLRDHIKDRPTTLREIVIALGDRAYFTLVILLTLPFLTPIPVPGLSTVFGIIIAWIGICLAIGREPSLPRRFAERRVPAKFFQSVFRFASGLLRLVEKLIRPRWLALTSPKAIRVHASLIVVAAAALLLPLPIPLTNTFPGWAILLAAAGLAERDGAFVVAAYAAFVLGCLYFFFLGEAAARLFHAARQALGF